MTNIKTQDECNAKLDQANQNNQLVDTLIEKYFYDDISINETLSSLSNLLNQQSTLIKDVQQLKCSSIIKNDIKTSTNTVQYIQNILQNTPVTVDDSLLSLTSTVKNNNQNLFNFVKYHIKNGITQRNNLFSDLYSSPNRIKLFKKMKNEIEIDIYNDAYREISKNEPPYLYEAIKYRKNIADQIDTQISVSIKNLNLDNFQEVINTNKIKLDVKQQYNKMSLDRICKYTNDPNKIVKNQNEDHYWHDYKKQFIDLFRSNCNFNQKTVLLGLKTEEDQKSDNYNWDQIKLIDTLHLVKFYLEYGHYPIQSMPLGRHLTREG